MISAGNIERYKRHPSETSCLLRRARLDENSRQAAAEADELVCVRPVSRCSSRCGALFFSDLVVVVRALCFEMSWAASTNCLLATGKISTSLPESATSTSQHLLLSYLLVPTSNLSIILISNHYIRETNFCPFFCTIFYLNFAGSSARGGVTSREKKDDKYCKNRAGFAVPSAPKHWLLSHCHYRLDRAFSGLVIFFFSQVPCKYSSCFDTTNHLLHASFLSCFILIFFSLFFLLWYVCGFVTFCMFFC